MEIVVQEKIIRHVITLLFVKGFLTINEFLIMRDFIITNPTFKV